MSAWLPRPVYWLARKLLPIACVDALVTRETPDGREIGLIRRVGADDRTTGWALVGGRVRRGESLAAALDRHLRSSLGDVSRVGRLDTSHPLHVAEYSPDGRFGGRVDPNKHAVALAYVVDVTGTITFSGEAVAFEWFPVTTTPPEADFAFSHGSVVAALLRADPRLSAA